MTITAKKYCVLLLATLLGLTAVTTAKADDAEKKRVIELGAKLSLACQSCHGLGNNGKDATPWVPKITGQYADYTMAQIKAYRNGERTGGMSAHMKIASSIYEDEQYQAIALYLESLIEP